CLHDFLFVCCNEPSTFVIFSLSLHDALPIYSISYDLNPETEELDFERIRQIAIEKKPKLIIAVASAYSRIIDWQKFRDIADEVRSEEHTSELQSRFDLVCRLLLEKQDRLSLA